MFAIYQPAISPASVVASAHAAVVDELLTASYEVCRLVAASGETFFQTDELVAARMRLERAQAAHYFVERMLLH